MNKIIAMAVLLAAVQGCALREPMPAEKEPEIPTLTPRASTYYDLLALPLEALADLSVTSVSKREQRLSEAAAAVFVITAEGIVARIPKTTN